MNKTFSWQQPIWPPALCQWFLVVHLLLSVFLPFNLEWLHTTHGVKISIWSPILKYSTATARQLCEDNTPIHASKTAGTLSTVDRYRVSKSTHYEWRLLPCGSLTRPPHREGIWSFVLQRRQCFQLEVKCPIWLNPPLLLFENLCMAHQAASCWASGFCLLASGTLYTQTTRCHVFY